MNVQYCTGIAMRRGRPRWFRHVEWMEDDNWVQRVGGVKLNGGLARRTQKVLRRGHRVWLQGYGIELGGWQIQSNVERHHCDQNRCMKGYWSLYR